MQIKKETTNTWEYKVGNNANIDNYVFVKNPIDETKLTIAWTQCQRRKYPGLLPVRKYPFALWRIFAINLPCQDVRQTPDNWVMYVNMAE